MKLIWRLTLRISLALSLLLAGWAFLFYITVIDEVNDEVDDRLEAYSERIIRRYLAGQPLPSADNGTTTDYSLSEVDAVYADDRSPELYFDEQIYIPELDENGPVRVLRTIFRDSDGRLLELTVSTPTIEKDDLQEAILRWVVILYGSMLLAVILVSGWVF